MPVPAELFEPPAVHVRRPGLVRPVRIDRAGRLGPTRGQAVGKGWRRTSRGYYLPARFAADTPEQRIVEAAVGLGSDDAVTGWAALRWLGAVEFDGVDLDRALPVPLLVDDHRVDPPEGAFITAERRQVDDRRVFDGLAVTHPLRSVCFEMRFAPTLVEAVKIFDGTPDLLDLDHGVVGEYDGSLHLEGKQRARDIRREGAFRRLGLEYVTMVAADRRDPADFLRRTLDACRRVGRDRTGRWTVTPPAWWVPTTTVELRRALTSAQRSRVLRPRAG